MWVGLGWFWGGSVGVVFFPGIVLLFSMKTRCEGEEVVPSLQKLFSMLAVGKAVQMTVWS